MDRTKPPPIAVGEPCTFDHSMGGRTWQLYLHDNSGHAGVFGDSPEDCIRIAWDEYDRITLPARVELLRELAAQADEYIGPLGPVASKLTSGQMDLLMHGLQNAADALEASGRTEGP